jgi:hypothetical protein
MDNAREASNKYSTALEKVLIEVRGACEPGEELMQRISDTNANCSREMERYRNAYDAYYNKK